MYPAWLGTRQGLSEEGRDSEEACCPLVQAFVVSCSDFGIDLLPNIPLPCHLSILSPTQIQPGDFPNSKLPRSLLPPRTG